MRLDFRTERVDAFLRAEASGLEGRNDGVIEHTLFGRARMRKIDSHDGPGLDFNLPPDLEQARHVERTWLPASVHFDTVAAWERRLEWARDFWSTDANAERQEALASVAERAKTDAVAAVWYSEADEERRHYGVSADAMLEVVVRVSEATMPALRDWLGAVARTPDFRPRLTLDGIHFTEHEHVTRDHGQTTWAGFLGRQYPAMARGYSLQLNARRMSSIR